MGRRPAFKAIWGLVALGLVILGLAACAEPAAAACNLGKLAELPVTMSGLSPIVPAKINGADAHLIADSGAFFSLLTPGAAERFKLRVGPAPGWLTVKGVNGDAHVSATNVQDLTVLGVTLHKIDFLVGGPQLERSADGLLGENLLGVADVEFDLANGVIRIFKAQGCQGAVLAYWDTGKPYSVMDITPSTLTQREIEGTAYVNGARVGVDFDTGSPMSILTLQGARRAGVNPDGAGVEAAGITGGLGRRSVQSWLAPVKSFKIGDEEIKNTRLRIGGIELQDADMLLGADFFLSHRVYVARSQNKLYFTYNGGPVFRLDRTSETEAPQQPPPDTVADAAASAPAPPDPDEPKDAAGYKRRAAAFVARRDFAHAIADDTRAIELEPNDPNHLFDRAMARLGDRQPVLAMADLDQCLKLKPDHLDALMARGRLRLAAKDIAGAKTDFDAAIAINPATIAFIGEIYIGFLQFEPSIAMYDRLIAAAPKDFDMATALNNRCWARALWGKELDKALTDCDAALKLKPAMAGARDSRGLVHLRLGQFSDAIDDYDAALKRNPKVAWSLYGRGVAELKSGKTAEGAADLKAAEDAQPGFAAYAKRFGVAP